MTTGRHTLDELQNDSDGASTIELRLPARPEVLQLVRLSATFVAAQADLEFEEIADLMLAIDELCASVIGPAPAPRPVLVVEYQWNRESIEVSCRLAEGAFGRTGRAGAADGPVMSGPTEADGPAETSPALGRDAREWASFLSRQILGALVDEHVLDTGVSGWLRKRRVGAVC